MHGNALVGTLGAGPAQLSAGNRPISGSYDADIIILSLNRLSDTLQAVSSALAQRGVASHVTVLDQGSEPEVLQRLARAFGGIVNFALYAVNENLGVAGGRNLATKMGHGQIIIALDNDAVFQNKWIAARAVRRFANMPDLGALGFNILGTDGVRPDRSSWGYPIQLMPRFRDHFNTTTFVGAGHAIRRATWNVAGGYDSAFFFTWEEYDFCLRAIALGWRIQYDGSLTILHKAATEERIDWNGLRTTYFVRNRLIISRKWGASWIGLAPRMIGYLVLGLVNRQLQETVAGLRAAFHTKTPSPGKMSQAMRRYLYAHETRHRGPWFNRLRLEIFRRRPSSP